MKHQKKWDIQEQVKELRVIVGLQEQGQRAFRRATEKIVSQNKESIRHLKEILKEDLQKYSIAKMYDRTTINQAFKGRRKKKLAFSNSTVQQAKDAVEKYVFDSRNVLNLLLWELKKRQRVLKEMTAYLQTLKMMQQAEKPDSLENQRIRRLENSIEKVQIKLATAKSIYRTYLKIVDYLKDELLWFPLSIRGMEKTLASYTQELVTMTQMADEAIVARESITMELSAVENQFIEERKSRENTMNWQRRMLKDIVEKPHLRRDGPKRVMNAELQQLIDRETLHAASAKAESDRGMMKSQQKLISDIDNLMNAVHCSQIEDIAVRIAEQNELSVRLQDHLEETTQKQEHLLARLHGLEIQHAKMKFHYKHGLESFKILDMELKSNLLLEEERLERMKRKLFQNQDLCLTVKNGINNLYSKLSGVTIPNKDPATATPKQPYKRLDVCQEKLLYLLEAGASSLQEDWLKDEHDDAYIQVRDLLETSTGADEYNRRVDLEDEIDPSKEAFEFEAAEHIYAPTREDIKKQSQAIIDSKKKTTKSSKKKAKPVRLSL